MSKIQFKQSENFTLFVPSFIDDYGLTPDEFRIFSRIMRRCGSEGNGCWESIPSMVKSLQISKRVFRRSLAVLIEAKVITRTQRTGQTDILDFNICDKWEKSDKLPEIRKNIENRMMAAERQRTQQLNKEVGADTHRVGGCGYAPGVGADTHRGVGAYPHPKGSPLKVLPQGTPSSDSANAPSAVGVSQPKESQLNNQEGDPLSAGAPKARSSAGGQCVPPAADPVQVMRMQAQMHLVFEHWQKERNRLRAKFTEDRKRAVRARLKEGYSVEELCRAIDGVKYSKHHRGENDAGIVYDDLELICRKGSFVEKFIVLTEHHAGKPSAKTLPEIHEIKNVKAQGMKSFNNLPPA